MKNFKLLTKNAIIGYILLATVFISCVNKVEVTSEIIEQKVDYSKMPSYCNPKSYKILKVPKGYIVKFPGGTVDSYYYDTPEECQLDINEKAERSKRIWVNSGGADF